MYCICLDQWYNPGAWCAFTCLWDRPEILLLLVLPEREDEWPEHIVRPSVLAKVVTALGGSLDFKPPSLPADFFESAIREIAGLISRNAVEIADCRRLGKKALDHRLICEISKTGQVGEGRRNYWILLVEKTDDGLRIYLHYNHRSPENPALMLKWIADLLKFHRNK